MSPHESTPPMLRLASSRERRFYVRGELQCARCSETIFITRFGELTPVFEADCPDCGFDGAYATSDVRVRVLPERRARREAITMRG
jgi:hypothetical protein